MKYFIKMIIVLLLIVCIILLIYLIILNASWTAKVRKQSDNISVTTYKDGTVVIDYQLVIENNSSALTTASDFTINGALFPEPLIVLSSADIKILPLLPGSSQYSVKDFWLIQDSNFTTGFGATVHQNDIAAGNHVKVLVKGRFTGRV